MEFEPHLMVDDGVLLTLIDGCDGDGGFSVYSELNAQAARSILVRRTICIGKGRASPSQEKASMHHDS
jgi:hypothetical protein